MKTFSAYRPISNQAFALKSSLSSFEISARGVHKLLLVHTIQLELFQPGINLMSFLYKLVTRSLSRQHLAVEGAKDENKVELSRGHKSLNPTQNHFVIHTPT